MTRISKDRLALQQLNQKQTAQGTQLPDDVTTASDHLLEQVRATRQAIGKRDYDQANKNLDTLEATLDTIEKYLKQ